MTSSGGQEAITFTESPNETDNAQKWMSQIGGLIYERGMPGGTMDDEIAAPVVVSTFSTYGEQITYFRIIYERVCFTWSVQKTRWARNETPDPPKHDYMGGRVIAR